MPSANRTAEVTVTSTTAIPTDGQCTHIVATRLADFQVSEYKGLLAGAKLKALPGENRVTATAYAQPCANEPASPPWIADEQIVTFVDGANTLNLSFHRNVDVGVNAQFDDNPSALILRSGSLVRTGRNGEDSAGPNFSLDGWEVKQIPVPPATGGETLVFTTEGKGIPYSPRGMARTPDGTFVFQLAEVTAPLYVFSATGTALGTWRVDPALPAGAIQWSNTDGLDAIDATHFVRTGYLNTSNCDASGDHCMQAGLDILEKRTAADGSTFVAVASQIKLPDLAVAQLNLEYPVGVTAVGVRFAVTTLPDTGGSRLVLLNADGTLAAGPTAIADDVEGLFDDGAGRLVALDYNGKLTTYNDTDLKVRAGEQASFAEGVSLSSPFSITWRSAGTGSYVVLSSDGRLVYATPAFDTISNVGIDLSTIAGTATGMDYRPDTDELLLMPRVPPIDPATSTRIPVVKSYNLTTNALHDTIKLQPGVAQPLRAFTLAYIPASQQFVAHFRRPGGVADAALDAVAFVHNLDGSLAYSFDLRPFGFVRIASVSYRSTSDELVFVVVDTAGTTRLLVTDRAGKPRRSYRIDAVPYLSDIAPISSGPFAGDIGVVEGQPSFFARIFLP